MLQHLHSLQCCVSDADLDALFHPHVFRRLCLSPPELRTIWQLMKRSVAHTAKEKSASRIMRRAESRGRSWATAHAVNGVFFIKKHRHLVRYWNVSERIVHLLQVASVEGNLSMHPPGPCGNCKSALSWVNVFGCKLAGFLQPGRQQEVQLLSPAIRSHIARLPYGAPMN